MIEARRLDLALEVAPFLFGSLLVASVVFAGVPTLAARGVEPLGAWMLLSVPLVFGPILSYGLALVRSEDVPRLAARLRLRALSRRDLQWASYGALAIVGLSAPLALVAQALGLAVHPPTIPAPPGIHRETLWMVGVWFVYWPINILGEELVWRGVVLPRMEQRFGSGAWLVNAALWFAFHLAFGPGNLLVLVPTLLVVPYATQRTGNTWVGVILHAVLSGPGFAAMALGLT